VTEFRNAFPRLYRKVYDEGRLAGYAEARAELEIQARKSEKILERERVTQDGKTSRKRVVDGWEMKKKELVAEYQKTHPGVSLKDAVLAVGRLNRKVFRDENPDVFEQ
jgi:hypothetical protein